MQVWVMTQADLCERTAADDIASSVVGVFASLELAVEYLYEVSHDFSIEEEDDAVEVDICSSSESASLTIGDAFWVATPHEVQAYAQA